MGQCISSNERVVITAATSRRVYEPEWERQQKKQKKDRTSDGAEVPLPARKWATGVGKEATTAQKIAQAKVDRVVPGPGPLPVMEDSPVSVTLASGGGLAANLGLKAKVERVSVAAPQLDNPEGRGPRMSLAAAAAQVIQARQSRFAPAGPPERASRPSGNPIALAAAVMLAQAQQAAATAAAQGSGGRVSTITSDREQLAPVNENPARISETHLGSGELSGSALVAAREVSRFDRSNGNSFVNYPHDQDDQDGPEVIHAGAVASRLRATAVASPPAPAGGAGLGPASQAVSSKVLERAKSARKPRESSCDGDSSDGDTSGTGDTELLYVAGQSVLYPNMQLSNIVSEKRPPPIDVPDENADAISLIGPAAAAAAAAAAARASPGGARRERPAKRASGSGHVRSPTQQQLFAARSSCSGAGSPMGRSGTLDSNLASPVASSPHSPGGAASDGCSPRQQQQAEEGGQVSPRVSNAGTGPKKAMMLLRQATANRVRVMALTGPPPAAVGTSPAAGPSPPAPTPSPPPAAGPGGQQQGTPPSDTTTPPPPGPPSSLSVVMAVRTSWRQRLPSLAASATPASPDAPSPPSQPNPATPRPSATDVAPSPAPAASPSLAQPRTSTLARPVSPLTSPGQTSSHGQRQAAADVPQQQRRQDQDTGPVVEVRPSGRPQRVSRTSEFDQTAAAAAPAAVPPGPSDRQQQQQKDQQQQQARAQRRGTVNGSEDGGASREQTAATLERLRQEAAARNAAAQQSAKVGPLDYVPSSPGRQRAVTTGPGTLSHSGSMDRRTPPHGGTHTGGYAEASASSASSSGHDGLGVHERTSHGLPYGGQGGTGSGFRPMRATTLPVGFIAGGNTASAPGSLPGRPSLAHPASLNSPPPPGYPPRGTPTNSSPQLEGDFSGGLDGSRGLHDIPEGAPLPPQRASPPQLPRGPYRAGAVPSSSSPSLRPPPNTPAAPPPFLHGIPEHIQEQEKEDRERAMGRGDKLWAEEQGGNRLWLYPQQQQRTSDGERAVPLSTRISNAAAASVTPPRVQHDPNESRPHLQQLQQLRQQQPQATSIVVTPGQPGSGVRASLAVMQPTTSSKRMGVSFGPASVSMDGSTDFNGHNGLPMPYNQQQHQQLPSTGSSGRAPQYASCDGTVHPRDSGRAEGPRSGGRFASGSGYLPAPSAATQQQYSAAVAAGGSPARLAHQGSFARARHARPSSPRTSALLAHIYSQGGPAAVAAATAAGILPGGPGPAPGPAYQDVWQGQWQGQALAGALPGSMDTHLPAHGSHGAAGGGPGDSYYPHHDHEHMDGDAVAWTTVVPDAPRSMPPIRTGPSKKESPQSRSCALPPLAGESSGGGGSPVTSHSQVRGGLPSGPVSYSPQAHGLRAMAGGDLAASRPSSPGSRSGRFSRIALLRNEVHPEPAASHLQTWSHEGMDSNLPSHQQHPFGASGDLLGGNGGGGRNSDYGERPPDGSGVGWQRQQQQHHHHHHHRHQGETVHSGPLPRPFSSRARGASSLRVMPAAGQVTSSSQRAAAPWPHPSGSGSGGGPAHALPPGATPLHFGQEFDASASASNSGVYDNCLYDSTYDDGDADGRGSGGVHGGAAPVAERASAPVLARHVLAARMSVGASNLRPTSQVVGPAAVAGTAVGGHRLSNAHGSGGWEQQLQQLQQEREEKAAARQQQQQQRGREASVVGTSPEEMLLAAAKLSPQVAQALAAGDLNALLGKRG